MKLSFSFAPFDLPSGVDLVFTKASVQKEAVTLGVQWSVDRVE